MEAKIRENSEAFENAIRKEAQKILANHDEVDQNIDDMFIENVLLEILLNDSLEGKTGFDWEKFFRKEYNLKAPFTEAELNKLSPTVREAFLLADEVYSKLPSNYDGEVQEKDINKKNYSFFQRGEEAKFDNAGTNLGTVIRIDVRTQIENDGTLIYFNQGYKKGVNKDKNAKLARIFVINFVEEFDENLSISKANSIKSASLF